MREGVTLTHKDVREISTVTTDVVTPNDVTALLATKELFDRGGTWIKKFAPGKVGGGNRLLPGGRNPRLLDNLGFRRWGLGYLDRLLHNLDRLCAGGHEEAANHEHRCRGHESRGS